jgi:hypothetical protein
MLRVNNDPLSDGRGSAPGVASGNHVDVCGEAELPATGPFKLTAIADPGSNQFGYNEADNEYEIAYTPTQQPTAPSKPTAPLDPAASTLPAPVAAGAQVDLTISAVKVNGRVPDGKDAVIVTVKNAGKDEVGSFAVRLAVEGGETIEESVKGLEAGKEREVRFENVRLKNGAHKLAVTLDPDGAVAESNEDDNGREVIARCKDD